MITIPIEPEVALLQPRQCHLPTFARMIQKGVCMYYFFSVMTHD